MKKFSLTISFIMVTMLIIFMSCMKENDNLKEETLLIGMSQANLFEPWRIYMNDEIKQAAEEYGNIKIIFKDAAGDSEKQKDDIKDLINFGVDLLIVSINDSKQLTEAVKEAYEKVPVILLDRAVEGFDYTLYIGTDNESIGMQAGELVYTMSQGKEAHVIEVEGFLNSNPDEERKSGFEKVIDQYNNIEIEWNIVARWSKDEAEDKVKEILLKDTSINVIFAHSDYMALGAYNAVKELNLEEVIIIGADGLKGENGGIEMIKNGMIQGTFTCPTGGKEAIENAVKILKQEEVPKKIILPCKIITKDNIKEFIN